jgi:4-aminobutyrate aminotransferase / (S)-3-amino-2-methylpropionate transaminase / 5-aminovalerate transaminase
MAVRLKTSIPGPKSKELMLRRQDAVARGPFHTTPLFVTRARGAILEDVDGNELIDFAAGIGVVNVGHGAKRIVQALSRQIGELLHGSFNVTPYEGYIALAEKLNKASPGSFKKKTFLANSGAEAVENAVKIARAFTGRPGIVCFEHAFHGRTFMAMSLTYKEKPYRAGFEPLNSEVYRAPFPYCYRWPATSEPARVSQEAFTKFTTLVEKEMKQKPAAVIIEPVLGEGGFVPAPSEFLKRLQEYCAANGIVFIADEIQTGFGRTGTLFACEQLGVVPDLILTAKGLGGGMPISAVTGRAEIMDGPGEGGIGGTFGGNPVACAAALAVFETFEKEGLLDQATRLGMTLRERLLGWKEKYPVIGDVRGLGPMLAMEFVKDRVSKEPYPEAAKGLVKYCYERGLVVMTSGSHGNVVRLLMPLTIAPSDLDEGLRILESGIQGVAP